jgi:hypothetical protein
LFKKEGIMSDPKALQTQKQDDPLQKYRNQRVPKSCARCPFSTQMYLAGGLVELHVCGHPKSFEVKGGMLAIDVWEPPTEDCPFVHNEIKHEGKPVRRWLSHFFLRRAKKMKPPQGMGGGGNP